MSSKKHDKINFMKLITEFGNHTFDSNSAFHKSDDEFVISTSLGVWIVPYTKDKTTPVYHKHFSEERFHLHAECEDVIYAFWLAYSHDFYKYELKEYATREDYFRWKDDFLHKFLVFKQGDCKLN